MPSIELIEAADEGRVVLGGCEGEGGKRRECSSCGFRWGDLPLESFDLFGPFAAVSQLDPEGLMSALDDRFVPRLPEELITEAPVVHETHDGSGPGDSDQRGRVHQLVLGDPELVVMTLRSDLAVEIDEYALAWRDPATPVAHRLGEPLLLPASATIADPIERSRMLVRLVKESARRRAAKFSRCSTCGVRVPPEDKVDASACSSCFAAAGGVFQEASPCCESSSFEPAGARRRAPVARPVSATPR